VGDFFLPLLSAFVAYLTWSTAAADYLVLIPTLFSFFLPAQSDASTYNQSIDPNLKRSKSTI